MPPEGWEPIDWDIIAPPRDALDRLREQISTAGRYTEMLDNELESLIGSYMEDVDQGFRNRTTDPSENISTVEPLAPWELELLQASTPQSEGPIAVPDVGTANAEQGGTPMPNGDIITIAIPITKEVIAAGFTAMRAQDSLIEDRSLDNWNTVRVMLNDNIDVAKMSNHKIIQGRWEIGYPAIRIAGRSMDLDNIPFEFAAQLIEAATNGRLALVRDPDASNIFEVMPVNGIAKEAWYDFNGASKVGSTNDLIRTYELRDIVSNFDYFWKGSARRGVIKRILERRRSMERPVIRHNTAFTVDTSAKFGQFFEKVKSSMRPTPSPFTLMPILPALTLSSRRWGIEIEAVDIEGVDTPEGWELKDDGSLRGINSEASMQDHDSDCASYDTSESCDCGTCMNDCDCGYDNQEYNDGGETDTGEWNSPVLRSFHSRGLRYLCSQLENRETNQSPGVHVHVEASDLTPEQAFRLSVIYSSLEPLFQSEYGRFDRHYCQPVDLAELVKRMNQVREVNANGGSSVDMEFFSRYWAVNLASLSQHGTVEFRAMGPRYNYEHLTRWAQFCREMVNIAKADVPQREWAKVRTFQDVLVLFSKYGKETPTPTWAKNVPAKDVVAALGKELRRIPNVVTHPDGVSDVFEAYYLKKDRLVPSVMNNNW